MTEPHEVSGAVAEPGDVASDRTEPTQLSAPVRSSNEAPPVVEEDAGIDPVWAKRSVEAILMAAVEPVALELLANLIGVTEAETADIIDALGTEYEQVRRGFVIAAVAGGYRYQTHPDLVGVVEQYVLEGRHARLSGPALETLAIIAYKQPVSRGQITAIRGVNADRVVRTLVERGYVEQCGVDPGPGNAALFATTQEFLERMGINALEDLPSLAEFIPGRETVAQLERTLRIEVERADLPPEVLDAIDEAGAPQADDADDDQVPSTEAVQ
ncbi:MAG: SMC-Scp complex subunit ScpB [Actinobacteria bacterium]|nr:SMC-Scp complex subunit ScpB [Actinomycetota bacterium]MCB9388589.1 SMC-Scp complex subunit ScpB [Acidimicrobiia bacterium]